MWRPGAAGAAGGGDEPLDAGEAGEARPAAGEADRDPEADGTDGVEAADPWDSDAVGPGTGTVGDGSAAGGVGAGGVGTGGVGAGRDGAGRDGAGRGGAGSDGAGGDGAGGVGAGGVGADGTGAGGTGTVGEGTGTGGTGSTGGTTGSTGGTGSAGRGGMGSAGAESAPAGAPIATSNAALTASAEARLTRVIPFAYPLRWSFTHLLTLSSPEARGLPSPSSLLEAGAMRRVRTLAVSGFLALFALVAGAPADHDRAHPPRLDSHGVTIQPLVTLRLSVTGERAGTGATVTITGTFRGRAVAGHRTYRLLPVGRAIVTHRHGPGAAQRARVEQVFVDVRSDSEYLRVVGSGPLIGGPVIRGPGGACQRIAVRYTVRPAAGTAGVRWACRRAGADRSPPIHLDVLSRPRDTIVSSYTIIRRPCSPGPAPAGGGAKGLGQRDAPCPPAGG